VESKWDRLKCVDHKRAPEKFHGEIQQLSSLARQRHRAAVLPQFAGSQALSGRNGDASLMTYTWRTGRGARAAESDSLLMN
jgi:hypothetical protein